MQDDDVSATGRRGECLDAVCFDEDSEIWCGVRWKSVSQALRWRGSRGTFKFIDMCHVCVHHTFLLSKRLSSTKCWSGQPFAQQERVETMCCLKPGSRSRSPYPSRPLWDTQGHSIDGASDCHVCSSLHNVCRWKKTGEIDYLAGER